MADIPHTKLYRCDFPALHVCRRRHTARITAREIEAFILGLVAGGLTVFGFIQIFPWR